jgi:hypothetical protein
MVHGSLGRKQDPISKITIAQRVEAVAHTIEHLPHKYKALSSNPNTTTTKNLMASNIT